MARPSECLWSPGPGPSGPFFDMFYWRNYSKNPTLTKRLPLCDLVSSLSPISFVKVAEKLFQIVAPVGVGRWGRGRAARCRLPPRPRGVGAPNTGERGLRGYALRRAGRRAVKGGPSRSGGIGHPSPHYDSSTRRVKAGPSATAAADWLIMPPTLTRLRFCGKAAENVEKTNARS